MRRALLLRFSIDKQRRLLQTVKSPRVLKGFPLAAVARVRANPYEYTEAKYLDTLLLLKLTITPFASVGYHGGRSSTLEVRPHYTWLLSHTDT